MGCLSAYNTSGVLTETRHYYFSDQWQIVREMVSGSTAALYIWGLRYIDELLVRYDPTYGRKYAMQDANFNCTAICDDASTGTVDERYQYDPYAGNRIILDSSWNVISSSTYNWTLGHQGLMFEAEVGIYNCRNRVYLPMLGTWMQRDPLGYADWVSLYQYISSSPIVRFDPFGLFSPGDSIYNYFPAPCPSSGPCIPINPFGSGSRHPIRPISEPVRPWLAAPDRPAPVPRMSTFQPAPMPWDSSFFHFGIGLHFNGRCCGRFNGLLVCFGIESSCSRQSCRCCPSNGMGFQEVCKICITMSVHVWGSTGCEPEGGPDLSIPIVPPSSDCCGTVGTCEGEGCLKAEASGFGQSVSCEYCIGKGFTCNLNLGRPKLEGIDLSLSAHVCVTCIAGSDCEGNIIHA